MATPLELVLASLRVKLYAALPRPERPSHSPLRLRSLVSLRSPSPSSSCPRFWPVSPSSPLFPVTDVGREGEAHVSDDRTADPERQREGGGKESTAKDPASQARRTAPRLRRGPRRAGRQNGQTAPGKRSRGGRCTNRDAKRERPKPLPSFAVRVEGRTSSALRTYRGNVSSRCRIP